MPVRGAPCPVSVTEPGPAQVPQAQALKKYSTFGSQNNQNILYVTFSYTLHASVLPKLMNCALKTQHMLSLSALVLALALTILALVPAPPHHVSQLLI